MTSAMQAETTTSRVDMSIMQKMTARFIAGCARTVCCIGVRSVITKRDPKPVTAAATPYVSLDDDTAAIAVDMMSYTAPDISACGVCVSCCRRA